jgi:peptidyl-tRNA hydrolase, PTH1 family
MKVIFAQGNPGDRYTVTRHNVGFIVLDHFAQATSASWKTSDKFNATLAELTLKGEKVLLVKPHSFYNETGQVARAIVDFYKLTPATDMLVVHDELALPFGTLRIREKGSPAGNNGIKSLNAHLGEDYWRLRIGVWNEQRTMMDDARFVLSNFSSDERSQLTRTIDEKIISILEKFIENTLQPTSHSA